MTYEDYDLPQNRALCRKLLEPIITQAVQYRDQGYELVAIIGINESPNCSLSGQRGVFMEEHVEGLSQVVIQLPYMEVSTTYGTDPQEDLRQREEPQQFLRTKEKKF